MLEERRKLFCRVGFVVIMGMLIAASPCRAQLLTNDKLSVTVNPKDGSYQLALRDGQPCKV